MSFKCDCGSCLVFVDDDKSAMWCKACGQSEEIEYKEMPPMKEEDEEE